MTNSGVKVDDKELIKALSSLDYKKMNKAYSQGMKKALDPILKQTKLNLRKSGIKNVNKPYVSKSGQKYSSMLSGVKTSVNMKDEDGYGKVHIMGEFRLKWFEKGTTLRKTKKGKNRGSISPKWFFRDAFSQKMRESEEILDDSIRQSILKVWNNSK